MNRQNQVIQSSLMLCWLLLLSWSGQAAAVPCLNGNSDCETIHVYRMQSRLPLPAGQDALGRSFLSLVEANAGDETAFHALLPARTTSTDIAIRMTVTRITDKSNNYCNCNLEENTPAGKGCHADTALATLQVCRRVCRYDLVAADCKVAGSVKKHDGGTWYAFPAATQCGGIRVNWKKRGLGNAVPTDCDWDEAAPVAKAASCIANQRAVVNPPTLATLFGAGSPCPDVHW